MYGFVAGGGFSALCVLLAEDCGLSKSAQTSLCIKLLLVGKPFQLILILIFTYLFIFSAVACVRRQPKSMGVVIAISLYFQ